MINSYFMEASQIWSETLGHAICHSCRYEPTAILQNSNKKPEEHSVLKLYNDWDAFCPQAI